MATLEDQLAGLAPANNVDPNNNTNDTNDVEIDQSILNACNVSCVFFFKLIYIFYSIIYTNLFYFLVFLYHLIVITLLLSYYTYIYIHIYTYI